MKLLVITQKIDINDDILGFFHQWVEKLAEKAEEIYVIANFVGEHRFPLNVKVFSLGKEKGHSKIRRYFLFYKEFFKILAKTDGIFFHMCPEYVIATGLLPKILRKKTLLWYTHKSVNWKLRLAEKLVDKIFAASKESFRLPSKKVEIVGHGIDIKKFSISNFQFSNKFRIITTGRIAAIKNLDVFIEAAEILKNNGFDFEIKIAGAPILEEDKKYFEELKNAVKNLELEDKIEFVGSIPYAEIEKFYQSADLFINLSDTGSIDKAVLEAMACGLNVLTSNEAFKDILPEENFTEKNSEIIAEKIINLLKSGLNPNPREYVVKNHNLNNLIDKIARFYGKRY